VPAFWTSGGVLHVRSFPIFSTISRTTSEDATLEGTGCGLWNANLRPADCLDPASQNFGACDGEEWGTGVSTLTLDGALLGSWPAHYQGKIVGGVSSGASIGKNDTDESTLRLEYRACLVCGADETWTGTILFPHG